VGLTHQPKKDRKGKRHAHGRTEENLTGLTAITTYVGENKISVPGKGTVSSKGKKENVRTDRGRSLVWRGGRDVTPKGF